MAEKLGSGGATVHKLPVGDAAPKADGKAKPPKEPKAATPPTSDAKPAKDPKPPKEAKEERPIGADHNSPEARDRAIREAVQGKIIGLSTRHREVDNRIEVLKSQIDEEIVERKEIRAAIQSCVRLEIFDEGYKLLRLRTARTDLDDIARQRALVWEAFGLTSTRQGTLDLAPEKTLEDWELEGYRAGILGEHADPAEGLAGEEYQAYMKGHQQAMIRNAGGIKTLDLPLPATSPTAPTPLEKAVEAATPPAGAAEDEPQEGDDELEAVRGRMAGGTGSELMD